MGTLRKPETEAAYTKAKQEGLLEAGCPLCKAESIKEFTFWRIIPNAYPYDLVAIVHHMFVPKRHVDEDHLTPEEEEEFKKLQTDYIQEEYEFTIIPSRRKRSIPAHAHLHAIVAQGE